MKRLSWWMAAVMAMGVAAFGNDPLDLSGMS